LALGDTGKAPMKVGLLRLVWFPNELLGRFSATKAIAPVRSTYGGPRQTMAIPVLKIAAGLVCLPAAECALGLGPNPSEIAAV
jgi:hypothetical protein